MYPGSAGPGTGAGPQRPGRGRFADSGPVPTRPAQALPRDRTPEFARRGPDRAAAVEPPPGAASPARRHVPGDGTGRGPARPAVGREGPALGRRRKGNRISYCYGPLTTAIFTRNSYDITHRRSCGASTYEIRVPAAARTAPHKRKQVASAARHENFSNFVGKPARRACVEKYAQVDHSVLS